MQAYIRISSTVTVLNYINLYFRSTEYVILKDVTLDPYPITFETITGRALSKKTNKIACDFTGTRKMRIIKLAKTKSSALKKN